MRELKAVLKNNELTFTCNKTIESDVLTTIVKGEEFSVYQLLDIIDSLNNKITKMEETKGYHATSDLFCKNDFDELEGTHSIEYKGQVHVEDLCDLLIEQTHKIKELEEQLEIANDKDYYAGYNE